jgi:asparagine synthase (glutamine-hydrolysing)
MMGVRPLTFTIGFSDNEVNETSHARKIAQLIGTDHHEFIVSVEDAVPTIDSLIDTFDEPFADSSAIPTLLMSRFAKEHVSVALSGEGGDELFMGYGAYRWARRLNNPFLKMFRSPLESVFARMASKYQRVSELLSYSAHTNLRSHIFSQEQYWFSASEVNSILKPGYLAQTRPEYLPASLFDQLMEKNDFYLDRIARKLNPMEKQALFDLQFYLQDDLLTKTDRCGMVYSLEARVPFLDHRVVEYALNLSPNLKIKSGSAKYILKRILYNYLPKEMFDRPKEGFDIPLNKWLKKELKYLIDENLNESIIKKYDIVDPDKVKDLLSRYHSGSDYLYNRIWQLIVLHKWMQRFGN